MNPKPILTAFTSMAGKAGLYCGTELGLIFGLARPRYVRMYVLNVK